MHSALISVNGSVYSWGAGRHGQLGYETPKQNASVFEPNFGKLMFGLLKPTQKPSVTSNIYLSIHGSKIPAVILISKVIVNLNFVHRFASRL